MRLKVIKAAALVTLCSVTVSLYLSYERLDLTNTRFRLEASVRYLNQASQVAMFESQVIPQPSYLPAAHSSSFTMMPNGDLLAFWFAGTREGSPDVKIWSSTYHLGKWSMAHAVLDPSMIAKANHRYVIKVGNPVIYRAQSGELHLFVVSVSVGGWSGSALNHLISNDDGKTWSQPERIVISPFFNLSTLVRTSAVSLSDGGFYLPVYLELGRKYPELLRFSANGDFIEQIRITAKNRMIQPSIMPISSDSAWAYFRNSSTNLDARELFAAKTLDGGKSWSKPEMTNLTNPDSSLEVVNLADGRYLMVYNQDNRSHLNLAISVNGLYWRKIYELENTSGDEFSYPSVHVNNGYIDILYTNNRKTIKHVRFNREWLSEVIKHATVY
ncbi:MAG: exo-alpha-sialidase [Burkholderiales bacterium]|nr:exo-alpha-sialidase [Burkholderiales bacterium]